jgi:hypothetical protein
MIHVYIGKGSPEVAEPTVYVFETDLYKDEFVNFLNKKAREYEKEVFGDKEPYDQFFYEFIVDIGGREYAFCLGDHTGFPELGFSVYSLLELELSKIKINHEDLI